jgi:hypothetical protein
MMALATHVQNHLVVAYLALRDLVDEMEAIATRGIASSGTGRRLTPLPPGEWERMAGPLHRIVEEARALAERHAPERLQEYETRGPIGQTRSWLSIQTGRLEDALRDLSPARLARFGALDPELTADLDQRLPRCQAEIDALRNRKREPGPGKDQRERGTAQ